MADPAPVRVARQGYDPKALEKEMEAFWAEHDIRARVREARAEAPKFYFVDGPPYTSGHIHLGTAWNKVMKDLNVRYRTMRGLNVRDQPGYDMHGLPIEVRVERELGITTKQEIEELGVGTFVDRCRTFAVDFLDAMTEEFKELGVWLDWDEPYRTIDDAYIEGAWWALKQAHEKGLLYRDNRGGLSWCPRCETALAQAEVEYEDRQDPSIYVKFPLVDREEFLVIWTTTPWTLPANNAVAVHPELTYARVLATRRDGSTETIIVEETLVDDVARAAKYQDTTVIDHLQGEELEGWAYEHPFTDEVPYHQQRRSEHEYTVLLGEHVAADRTGLVHTATGHGAEDFEVGLAYDIPPFCPVGPDGTYNELAGELEGLVVRKAGPDQEAVEGPTADQVVIEDLSEKDLLLAEGRTTHSYGHCWRCKTPILYRTTEQWFLRVTEVKDRMLEEVARVKWTPEWAGAARQRDWVENARDWCISRQRYWGIPVPVWECDETGEWIVVGSAQELKELTGRDAFEDLHRPWVDEVVIEREGKTFRRVPDVLDVWFDSAVASWASLGYPGDQQAFEEWFPCDFIIEGLDQTRGWFYSQLAAGVVAMDRVPYEEVVMHGFVHDAEGRPMSKSIGNIVAPSEVIADHGADAMRFSLLEQAAPWGDLSYGPGAANEAARALNILWNVHYFATQYMAMDDHVAGAPDWQGEPPAEPLDAWMLSRLHSTVATVTEHLEAHEYHRAARAVRSLVLDDLSRWYVRLNRDRAWKAPAPERAALYGVLTTVMATVARLLSPFTPYVAEALWQDLYPDRGGSVHEQDWPVVGEALVDDVLEQDVATVREVVESVSQARERAGLSLRWPVPRIVLAGDETVARAVERLEPVLVDQANAKSIEYAGRDWEELLTVAEPVRSVIGPRFKGDAPKVMEAIRAAEADALKATLAEAGQTELAGFTVTEEMVSFTTEVPEGILGSSFDAGSVFVDAHLDEGLKAEGLAREVLRRIQEGRKQQDLDIEAVVPCRIEASDEALALLEPHAEELAGEARVELSFGEVGPEARAWEIENEAADVAETVRIALG